MIMLCKHCFDILGYDNKYTNRVINKECECCKKGLSKSDIIYAEDVIVPLLFKLNKELNIKTYYSCIGHIDSGIITPTYLVLEDTEKARYIFNEIITLKSARGYIRRDGRDKIRVEFNNFILYNNVYEYIKEKANLMESICNKIDNIVNLGSYPFK